MVGPVSEILTGGVGPVDVHIPGPIWVVLAEKMITTLPVDGTVRVVHPNPWRPEQFGCVCVQQYHFKYKLRSNLFFFLPFP